MLQDLEAPFTHEEIDNIIKQMPNDKAPGPNGFNAAFHRACWDIVAPDFYSLIHDFHAGRTTIQHQLFLHHFDSQK